MRRRRGDDFELSDEDDEVAERRRRKQREFARRTKALLRDEKIGKLAENEKKQAFLHALEDRDEDDDELDFLRAPENEDEEPSTAPQAKLDQQPDTQPPSVAASVDDSTSVVPSTNPLKRKPDARESRRTDLSKRPRNGLELKKTISDLVDDPVRIPDSQISDGDGSEVASDDDKAHANTSARPVTNRLALGALTESNLNAASGAAGGVAFHASRDYTPVFKVPSLLRRASTNISTASNSSASASVKSASVDLGIKRGGSKKSNIHYQAREAERRKVLEEAEQRRRHSVKSKVLSRTLQGSVLGKMFGASRAGFE